ncbi:MAG: TetR family transcriptional regulator C-terminal domain-containing protein, partial [Myxococcales bacterium]|nr:TetR family transcriptional regulator C-terminal domain-containing protein [Myxococcales bacterium]
EGLEAIVALPGVAVQDKLRLLVHAAFPSTEAVEREVRLQSEVFSFAKDEPAARAAVVASYRRFRDACAALLEEGAKEGLTTTTDREWAYLFIHALIDGLTFQLAVQPELDLAGLRVRLERVILALAEGAADPRPGERGGDCVASEPVPGSAPD